MCSSEVTSCLYSCLPTVLAFIRHKGQYTARGKREWSRLLPCAARLWGQKDNFIWAAGRVHDSTLSSFFPYDMLPVCCPAEQAQRLLSTSHKAAATMGSYLSPWLIRLRSELPGFNFGPGPLPHALPAPRYCSLSFPPSAEPVWCRPTIPYILHRIKSETKKQKKFGYIQA